MAVVKSNETVQLNASANFRLGRSMESHHKAFVQHSKSAVQSKVSKTSDGIGARAEKRKSNSHAEVPQKALKKRGVYVEKKSLGRPSRGDVHVSPLIQAYMAHTDRRAHPTRRSPSPKHHNAFISNVLSVLTKPSVSTQYPPDADTATKAHLLSNALKRNASISTNDEVATKAQQNVEPTRNKHKSKRRSPRPLPHKPQKPNSDRTPSNHSEVEPPRTKPGKKKHKKRSPVKELQRSLVNEHKSRIANAVLEGKEYKMTRRNLVDDNPLTLVSTMDQPEDKGLYKLFIDLLETTFSVYNVDTNVGSPAMGFRQRLNEYHHGKPQSYVVTDDRACFAPHPCRPLCRQKSAPPTFAKPQAKPVVKVVKDKVMRDSPSHYQYAYIRRPLAAMPVAEKRVKRNKRTQRKKFRDETLLGLLRHQLHMESEKPPQSNNLYQALRVIARNKIRRRRPRFRDEERVPEAPSPDRYTLRQKQLLTNTLKTPQPVLKKSINHFVKQLGGHMQSHMSPKDSEEEVNVPQIEEVSSYRTLEVLAYDKKGRPTSMRNLDSDDSSSWNSAHQLT